MRSATIGPALVAMGDGGARQGCIRVEAGRIASIEDGPQFLTYELPAGSTITPGLIDLHTNGVGRYWFNRDPIDALEALCSDAPTHGVTAFLPSIMTSPWDQMLHAATAISRRSCLPLTGARPLGLHFEGPFLNREFRRVHQEEFLLEPTPARVEALLDTWTTGRCRVTMAPEINGAARAAEELRRRGVVLSAGHTAATYAIGNAAIEHGFTILTHSFNAMPPLHHRKSSILTAYLLDPTAFCEVIADGVHVSPEHLALLYRLKGINLVATTDAMPLTDAVSASGGVAVTREGVIAGSLLTPDQGVRNIIAATGLLLPEAVVCATWAPARAIGLDDEIGTLREGMRADFTVWDRRNRVTHTFVGGELIYADG
ncbi:MAG TPA: amidohydrolase family protein [Candidatus Eremiobacteraceae bacterium]|nr:amidohydrolase family protein [Candidatus Eremiobacteraceae bacterium]